MAMGTNPTYTAGAADDLFVTVLNKAVTTERRPLRIPYELLHTKMDPIGKGLTVQHALQTDPGAAAALTDGTDMTNTELGTTSNTVVAAEQGIVATVTDLLGEVSVVAAVPHFAGVLARSYQERENDIFAVLYDGFNNETGTTGTDFTVVNLVKAVAALRAREVPGPYAGVVSEQHLTDLQVGSGGLVPNISYQATTGFGNDWLASGQLNTNVFSNLQRTAGPYNFVGVDLWISTSIPAVNNAADYSGGIFNKEAIQYHVVRDVRVRYQRDESLRATEIVVSGAIGASEHDGLRGQAVICGVT